MFNANPQQFFLGGFLGSNYFGSAGGGKTSVVTLKELFAGQTLSGNAPNYKEHGAVFPQIEMNLRDNLGSGVMQLVGISAARVLIGKLGVSRAFNKTVRSVGMGDLVKM